MKRFFLILTALFGLSSFAQIKFEAGYFISNDGTRTECFIKNIDWQSNPVEFEYNLALGEKSKTGKIAAIAEFGIGETLKYKRFTIQVDMSGQNAADLSHKKEPEWENATSFLKLLVDGNVALYEFSVKNTTRYFFSATPHDKATQLVYKEYVTDNTAIATNYFYRQQLFTALQSPKLTQSDFEKLKYNESDLIKIFLKYNNLETTTATRFQAKESKSTFVLKLLAGTSNASLTGNRAGIAGYDFSSDSKFVFRGGVEAELILPINRNKWSLFSDVIFQSYQYDGDYQNPFDNHTEKFSVDYKQLELSFGVRHYLFLNDSSKLYVNLGYALALPINASIEFNQTFVPGDSEIKKAGYLFGGIGFSYKRYFLEARFNPKYSLLGNDTDWYADYHTNFGFLLGYKIL